jgi:hypothetical protein
MKKLYILLVLVFILSPYSNLQAQNCGFAQTGVKYNYSSTDPVTGNCIINIDIYFDLFTNSGSKFITAHIWPKNIYPALTYDHPPDATQLSGAVTVVIDHFQDHDYAYIDDIYIPDANVHPQYIDMGLVIGPSSIGPDYDRFTITNLNLNVPGGCAIAQIFTMDVWATESSSMNNVHCVNTGKDFYANNPKANGAMVCGPPRSYNVEITSIDPNPMTVDYDVYIDNGDLNFNKVEDLPKIQSVTGIVISTASGYNSGNLNYEPYSNQYPEANRVLWIEVKSTSLPNTVIHKINNPCYLLPVSLKLFIAEKNEESVLLKWVTASESLNKGFYIERREGGRDWVTIAFVNSKAKGGNSQSELEYTYLDPLITHSIIQYRLKQIDIDGKFQYSAIRVIGNDGRNELTIFPNPSNGNLNILFPDRDAEYNVIIYSADGKKANSWKQCKSSLHISGLKQGLYILKFENLRKKELLTRKILVR